MIIVEDGNISELTNQELREMGVPDPCECLNTVAIDGHLKNTVREICADCGILVETHINTKIEEFPEW